MGRRGKFKYICEDCQAENWLTFRERGSHFRPRCVECGSTWLEPSYGSKAIESISESQNAAKERIKDQKEKMGINEKDKKKI